MFIGIYSPEQGRDYSAYGETLEEVISSLKEQIEEWGDEPFFNDNDIVFFRGEPINVKKVFVAAD